MNKLKRKTLILFAVLFLLPATCMALVLEHGTWRYKMTVTVETPEGLKTGSAVREVRVQRGWSPLPEMSPKIDLKGEAVVVDLGERGVLFALIYGRRGVDYGTRVPFGVFSKEAGSLTPESINRFSTLKAGPTEVAQKWHPVLVHFKDINDPKTISEARDLQCPPDHRECDRETGGLLAMTMEEAFGPGVRLSSITLEMSEEPVTKGIVDKYLPWLDKRMKLPGYLGSDPKRPTKDVTGLWISPIALKTKE